MPRTSSKPSRGCYLSFADALSLYSSFVPSLSLLSHNPLTAQLNKPALFQHRLDRETSIDLEI